MPLDDCQGRAYTEGMTMEQITAKAHEMGLSTQLMDLLHAAYDAGQDDRAADIAMDLADDGNTEAVEFLAANYGIHVVPDPAQIA